MVPSIMTLDSYINELERGATMMVGSYRKLQGTPRDGFLKSIIKDVLQYPNVDRKRRFRILLEISSGSEVQNWYHTCM